MNLAIVKCIKEKRLFPIKVTRLFCPSFCEEVFLFTLFYTDSISQRAIKALLSRLKTYDIKYLYSPAFLNKYLTDFSIFNGGELLYSLCVPTIKKHIKSPLKIAVIADSFGEMEKAVILKLIPYAKTLTLFGANSRKLAFEIYEDFGLSPSLALGKSDIYILFNDYKEKLNGFVYSKNQLRFSFPQEMVNVTEHFEAKGLKECEFILKAAGLNAKDSRNIEKMLDLIGVKGLTI